MRDKTTLYCFTYAGGTKEFFNEIAKDLKNIEVVSFDYAGHGERHKEPFYQDFTELADDIFQQFKDQYHGENYAMLGYSMGSITLVEVLKRIIASGMQEPQHVFLAAHEPHTKSELLGFTADELDEWVKDRTIRFGDVPERLLNNKVFWRTYLPIYRADYSIIAKYRFDELQLRSQIPATVFYSETDTPLSDMMQWKRFFEKDCTFHQFDGMHFFMRQHHQEMAEIIKMELQYDI